MRELKGNWAPSGYLGLMEKMAQRLGADLEAERTAGMISGKAIACIMKHCSACAELVLCHAWLHSPSGPVASTPCYCPNAQRLACLARIAPALPSSPDLPTPPILAAPSVSAARADLVAAPATTGPAGDPFPLPK